MEKDKKHPDRCKKAVLFRTAYAGPVKKESKLKACTQHNDDIANQVRVRVEGALSDLHAADARYHVNCMASFMSPKSISAAKNASKEDENTDHAFDEVIGEMLKDKSHLWNSHAGPFAAKAGTKSVTKNGASFESGTFEDW